MAHAELSPSSAFRWKSCTASIQQCRGKLDNSTKAARNGTICHYISEKALLTGLSPELYLGETFDFFITIEGKRIEGLRCDLTNEKGVPESSQPVTQEHVEYAQVYVDYVRHLKQTVDGILFVESRVPIDHITGEPDAKGTSDAVIIAGNEIIVVDLKTGNGKVDAHEGFAPNDQLAMYAHGAAREYEAFGPFESVRLVIVQPSLHHVSEFSLTWGELEAHIAQLTVAAELTRTAPEFVVTDDNCHFCKGRDTCAAREKAVIEAVFTDLEASVTTPQTEDNIAMLYSKIGVIEQWIDDLKDRVFNELKAGRPVQGYKLVAGKLGNREWLDEAKAEAALKTMRLKEHEMYSRKLISPTKADELANPKKGVEARLGERQWQKLQSLIHRPEGKSTVAVESDPRPAIPSGVDDLKNLDDLEQSMFS